MALIVSAMSLASCDGKEEVDYAPAHTPEGQRVYFAELNYTEEVADDATGVTLEIYRPEAVATDAFSVQLLADGNTDLLHVPAEVTFAAGETSASFTVAFDAMKLESAKPYTVNIAIDEAQANEYGISSTTLTVKRLSWTEWSELGAGTYTFTLWYEGDAPAKVMERHLETDANVAQYRFMVNFDEDDPEAYDLYLEASTDDGGKSIIVPEQVVGFHPSYGDVFLSDLYTYTGNPAYAPDSHFDAETGLFSLYMVLYCDAGVFGDGTEYCRLSPAN